MIRVPFILSISNGTQIVLNEMTMMIKKMMKCDSTKTEKRHVEGKYSTRIFVDGSTFTLSLCEHGRRHPSPHDFSSGSGINGYVNQQGPGWN